MTVVWRNKAASVNEAKKKEEQKISIIHKILDRILDKRNTKINSSKRSSLSYVKTKIPNKLLLQLEKGIELMNKKNSSKSTKTRKYNGGIMTLYNLGESIVKHVEGCKVSTLFGDS